MNSYIVLPPINWGTSKIHVENTGKIPLMFFSEAIHTHTNVHVHKTNRHVQKKTYEKTVPQSTITWSDLRKLNVQAKKVHNESNLRSGVPFVFVVSVPFPTRQKQKGRLIAGYNESKTSIHNGAFILRTGWRDALFAWNRICPAQHQKKKKRVQEIRNMSNIMDSTFPSQRSRRIR